MFGFGAKPLLADGSAEWMQGAFAWAREHFDDEEFIQRSRLVQPSNRDFPGRVDSIHSMAETVFEHSQRYAGLQHWPFQLVAPESFRPEPPERLDIQEACRRNSSESLAAITAQKPIAISYNPQQTMKPEDLASTFAHIMAQHLLIQSGLEPYGGPEFFYESTEVIAVMMGFGVMLANSAYTFRGSCARCYNGQANRQATLSEAEAVFALALYCHQRGYDHKDATAYLKPYLKGSYKKAIRQISR